MHKPFYASGFLYHAPSRKILLQQINDTTTNLVLFRGKSTNGNDPQTVFRRCLEKVLGMTIAPASIRPVYDYIDDKLGEQFVFFVETGKITPTTHVSNKKTAWLQLAKLSKYAMTEQTRHDIIVGERVIRALTDTHHGLQQT